MKRSIKIPVCTFAVLFTLIAALYTCRADLGDTYAQAIQHMGSKQSRTNGRWIVWNAPASNRCDVWMQFYHNQCVAIVYKAIKDRYLYQDSVWKILTRNSRDNQHWTEGQNTDEGLRQYFTDDGKILALSDSNGSWLRIAYRSWLDRNNLLDRPADNGRPPIEEDDAAPTPTDPSEQEKADNWKKIKEMRIMDAFERIIADVKANCSDPAKAGAWATEMRRCGPWGINRSYWMDGLVNQAYNIQDPVNRDILRAQLLTDVNDLLKLQGLPTLEDNDTKSTPPDHKELKPPVKLGKGENV